MDRAERTHIRSGDRVIEVGAPNLDLADWCLAQGASYLALVPSDHLAALQRTAGDRHAHRLAPLTSIDEIAVNNADVIVLHAPYHRLMWQKHVGSAAVIATPAGGVLGLETAVACSLVRRRRAQKQAWGPHRYLATAQPVYPYSSARHYLSPALGVAGLPERLDDHDITYAVLRWFDTLPHVEPGEDLDILVADDDLPALLGVLEAAPGTIACDVYSTTGLPNADYRGVAYYPPQLAEELLASTERHHSGYRVPDPRSHFRSLAYHAVYHKGERSGLEHAIAGLTAAEPPEHDYASVLTQLAPNDSFTGAVTMEALDDHLASVGWRPSRDNLARLAEHNAWLRQRHFPARSIGTSDDGATSVFLLREHVGDSGLAAAERVLGEHGFEVLLIHRLDDEARRRCKREMRGGNWGPGPYPVSGGEPAVALVALDRHPKVPSESLAARYPGLANANIYTTKLAVRDAILADLPEAEHFNPVHSSDSEVDAWEYVEMIVPEDAERIRGLVAARRHEVAPPSPPDRDIAAPPPTPVRSTPSARRRVRRIALWVPRRVRASLAYRLARWRLAAIAPDASNAR